MIRKPKKSDTIEVRLPHAVKRAFMEQCRAEGRTASDVVRGFVEARVAGEAVMQTPARSPAWFRPVAAAAMVAALAAAMPSAVTAAPDFRPVFALIDRNHDGLLSPAEYGNPTKPRGRGCGEHRVLALPLPRSAIPSVRGIRPFMISREDFSFDLIDADKDGRLSFAEFAAQRLRMFRTSFDMLDADHDGTLAPAEYAKAWNLFIFRGEQPEIASFQDLDRNGDGKVAWTEFLA